MKYIVKLIICLLLLPTLVYAGEWKLKAGYVAPTCKYVEPGASIEVAYEIKSRWVGLEGAVGVETHKIKQVGQLNTIQYNIIGKIYPIERAYIGGGVGYMNNFMQEDYNGQADVDNENQWLGVIGYNINDNLFIEVEGRIADLDIETGLNFDADIEKHSRLDSVMAKLGWRW